LWGGNSILILIVLDYCKPYKSKDLVSEFKRFPYWSSGNKGNEKYSNAFIKKFIKIISTKRILQFIFLFILNTTGEKMCNVHTTKMENVIFDWNTPMSHGSMENMP
jgi:hypothetical protein